MSTPTTPHTDLPGGSEPLLKLPPIALSDLPEATKDFILASANSGKSPVELMKELFNQAATRAGFKPSPNPKAA